MKKILAALVCIAAFCACGQQGNKSAEQLIAENDSLNKVIEQRNSELDDLLGTLNTINEGFRQINEAEGRMQVAKTGEGANRMQQLTEDVEFIQNQMQQNREMIAKLKRQLNSSSVQSKALQNTVDALTAQLEEKSQELVRLRDELEQKNIQIAALDQTIADLNVDVSNLKDETVEQSMTINSQDLQLNTAWYFFGTKAELKENKILTDGGFMKKGKVLRDDFNKSVFTKIDIRTVKEIKLYASKAEILTAHPKDSYEMEKDANGQMVLKITNQQKFWNASKYLVVQVK